LTRQLEKRRLEFRSAAGRLPKLDAVLQAPRQRLDMAAQKFGGALGRALARKRAAFDRSAGGLRPVALRRELQSKRVEEQRLGARLRPAVTRQLGRMRASFEAQATLLHALSHEGVLRRGFALVTGVDGHLVRSAARVTSGDALTLRFSDGEVAATASSGGPSPKTRAKPAAQPAEPPAAPPRPRIRRPKRGDDDTGSLF
jgi:exodeoxyribonuclease VII large subunit